MCIPQLITLAKGKRAFTDLLALAKSAAQGLRDPLGKEADAPAQDPPRALHSVSFAYPSRPHMRILSDVLMLLTAGEMMFIVGGSGSRREHGRGAAAAAVRADGGVVALDDQELGYLDDAWVCHQVAGVAQGCVLFDKSVHDNVALGKSRAPGVSREEVMEACRAAMMHEYVRDFPKGYVPGCATRPCSFSVSFTSSPLLFNH